MEIRQAKATDKGNVVDIVYSSGVEIYDYIFANDRHTAKDFIAYEFNSGRGFCGYNHLTVAILNDEVVGTGTFQDRRQHATYSLGTVFNIYRFYGFLGMFPVLKRAMHAGLEPKKGELYLSNFGVDRQIRSQGIGSRMIRHKVEWAKTQGYTSFGLDVASNNPRAHALYKRLGLHDVALNRFPHQREGYATVPDVTKMELAL